MNVYPGKLIYSVLLQWLPRHDWVQSDLLFWPGTFPLQHLYLPFLTQAPSLWSSVALGEGIFSAVCWLFPQPANMNSDKIPHEQNKKQGIKRYCFSGLLILNFVWQKHGIKSTHLLAKLLLQLAHSKFLFQKLKSQSQSYRNFGLFKHFLKLSSLSTRQWCSCEMTIG